MSPPQGINEEKRNLTNLNEIHKMVVLVVGTDGGEKLLKWSLASLGQSPVTHVKPDLLELLPEMISVSGVPPLDGMGACLHMHICCPGPDDRCIFLDVVHLGHPEDIFLGVGVEPTGESDIIHCRYGRLVHLLNEGIDWCVDVSSLESGVPVSSGDVNSLHHLTGLLGDECKVWIPTFLVVVDDDDVHIRFIIPGH